MNASEPHPRIGILGGEVDVITPGEMLHFVDILAAAGGSAVIANHNAHSLSLLRRNTELGAFFDDADLVQFDSAPLIAWARLLGLPVSGRHRSTYLDWREDFWPLANARGWKVFYLGGGPGVAERACAKLAKAWPRVAFGWRDGYFDTSANSPDNRHVVAEINAFEPDILFVGMGMPRQELWISQNRSELGGGVIFSVGAAFDYEAGVQTAAPRWLGPLGLEWLFRLANQPRRLGHRYLIEPWQLLGPAFADVRRALRGRRAGGRRIPAVDAGALWPLSSAN